MDTRVMLEAMMPAFASVEFTAARTPDPVLALVELTPGRLMVVNSLDIGSWGAGACETRSFCQKNLSMVC